MKYYIKTFGCQMNVYDSSRIAEILKSLGHRETTDIREADIVIFNTCHIREKAAEKVFSDSLKGMAEAVKPQKQGFFAKLFKR